MDEYPNASPWPDEASSHAPAAYVRPANQPVWPTVVGVISVVFGGLGMICLPVSLAMGTVGSLNRELMERAPDWYASYTAVSGCVQLAIAALLLAGGIYLLKRRPVARRLHVGYALATVCVTFLNTVLMATIVLPAISQATGQGPEQAGLMVGLVAGMIVGFFGGLAYPVFLLIWFSRSKIAGQVRQWSSR